MRESAGRLEQVSTLLGGAAILALPFATPLEAHEAIARGLPGRSLDHLVRNVPAIRRPGSLEKVVGISQRTLQRHREEPRRLSPEQSGRLYKFAEVLASATDVFGSQDDAERFLEEPATALDGARPLDLLSTPAGTELVENHLERVRYGVYT